MSRTARLLRNLQITRVDLVKRGANQDDDGGPEGSHVVFFKRADGGTPTPEESMKKPSEMTQEELVAKAEEQSEALETLRTEKEALEASVAKLQEQVEELTKGKGKGGKDDDEDDEEMKKDDLPENVRKALDEQERIAKEATERAEKAEKAAAKEREIRLEKEYREKAAEMPFIPGETDALAKGLRLLDELVEKDEDAQAGVNALREGLEKANELLSQSPLFEKIGKRTATEGSAQEKLTTIAKGIQEAENVTKEKAFTLAVQRNPKLAEEYRGEQ